MYEIEENIPAVKVFPTDSKIRVVWSYGALIENHNDESNIPKVEVLLKEVTGENELKDVPLIIKIEFTEIDIVRQGSIWQGRNRLNIIWEYYENYKENVEFRFDFTLNQPDCIKFLDKNPKNNNYYIPKQKYNFGNIQGNYGYQYHFANSMYTKIITNTGTTILVHGLEFLTSTYVPQEKNIRTKLLNLPIDSILDDYIQEDSHTKDDVYYMHFKENKRTPNNIFLSYLKYNQITRSRLNKLRTSLETGSKYKDRYPVVLPYHPERMRMIVDGIWLDDETFFVLRIKGCSLPNDNKIVIKKTKEERVDKKVVNKVESEGEVENTEETDNTSKNDEEHNNSQPVSPSEVDVDSGKRPYSRNQSLPIVSEVNILDEDDIDISYVEEVKEKDNYIYETELVKPRKKSDDTEEPKKTENGEENKVDTVSSGEPSQSDKDKNTISFEVIDNTEKSEMLALVEMALKDMKTKKETVDSEEKVYIDKLSFLNEVCHESEIDKRPRFYSFIDSNNRTLKSWCIVKNKKDEKCGYRSFMLIKIGLNNGLCAFLLEIDRRSESESFSGSLFNYKNGDITKERLHEFINKIVENKGVYSKRDKDIHKRVEIIYPVDSQKIYGHQKIKNSIYEKIKKVIKEAYNEGLFV